MTSIISKNTPSVNVRPGEVPQDIFSLASPLILKGVAEDWELVKKGLKSDALAIEHLSDFYNGTPVGAYYGAPENKGKYYYTESLKALNFERKFCNLNDVLDSIKQNLKNNNAPGYYVGSASIEQCLSGLLDTLQIAIPDSNTPPIKSIWLGNKSLIPCHFDSPMNIALCAVGKRKFTLFPPESIADLYPGPMELTPGGQVVSTADINSPNFDTHPRLENALCNGQVAELEAGDALYIPSMWWHQVEGLATFNVLINYWFDSVPSWLGNPINTLISALLTIRNRPENEKRAWKHLFEYYVFGDRDLATSHLSNDVLGILGELSESEAKQVRAMLLNRLNG